MNDKKYKKVTNLTALVFFIFIVALNVSAMSSSRYLISTDSINFAGSDGSTAGNFLLSDSLGELASGAASSSRYSISSGYRMLQTSYIAISAGNDVVLPEMSGMTAGQSLSSESWLVKTDNFAGYEMLVRSETSPALQSPDGGIFSDYEPAVEGIPDYFFFVDPFDSVFAFSPEGQDVSSVYLDNGDICGVGNFETEDRCWDGFLSTEKVVAKRNSSNHPGGTLTTIKYKTGIGSNKIQDSGAYSATIVVTAVVL